MRSHPRIWRRVRAHRVRAAQDQEPEREGQARGGQGEDLPQGFHRRRHALGRVQGPARQDGQTHDQGRHARLGRRHRLLRAREAGDVPLWRRVRGGAHRPMVPRVRRGVARAFRAMPRRDEHLPRRVAPRVPAHPRLAASVGVQPRLRPRHAHALGSAVSHRISVRFHHLHGVLHCRASAAGRGYVGKSRPPWTPMR